MGRRKIERGNVRGTSIESLSAESEPTPAPNDAKRSLTTEHRMWASNGTSYFPCARAVEALPPGQYRIQETREGVMFTKGDVNLDDLLELPDSAANDVISEIQRFWDSEQKFRDYGFVWKRGILLYGPPGSGKTSTIQQLSKMIIDKGGLAIYVDNPWLTATGLTVLRHIEPKRPIVLMLEDIDVMTASHGAEQAILSLLDGELQTDNVVTIATTNYPERLDKRMTNRPSRFDIVKYVGFPSAEARAEFLRQKCHRFADGANVSELDRWVELTQDYSVSHLKELIILVDIFGYDLDAAVARLNEIREQTPSSDKFEKEDRSFGFVTK